LQQVHQIHEYVGSAGTTLYVLHALFPQLQLPLRVGHHLPPVACVSGGRGGTALGVHGAPYDGQVLGGEGEQLPAAPAWCT
jgi:hypothetical protein